MDIKDIKLSPGEHIVHIERASLIMSFPLILVSSFIVVAPFFFFFPLLVFGAAGVMLLFIISGFGAMILLRAAIKWRGTLCVLTSSRIFSIQQKGFFQRTTSEANLRTVNDIAYKWQGFLGRIFKVGTVRVLFRGVIPTMIFESIFRPNDLTRIIQELKDVPIKRSKRGETFTRKHFEF
jgi:hypothetical protein